MLIKGIWQAGSISPKPCRAEPEPLWFSAAQQRVQAIRNLFVRLRKSHGPYGRNVKS